MSFRMTAGVIALAILPGRIVAQQAGESSDWKQVDQALGRAGATLPGNVYRFGFPRGDLHVTVGTVTVKPALALGSWVAFKQTGDSEATVMGDLVLLESEVGPVIHTLQESGIEQTALHNHLLHEVPHVLYLHIAGKGRPAQLATAVHTALAFTGTPLVTPGGAPVPSPALDLDTAQIAQVLGYHGRANGGVYQLSVPRAETVTVDGAEVPAGMGVATALNFQPTGSGKAAITGDFVLVASEINPVLRALRASRIEVTALHSHMLAEAPRLFFMHFWANDNALSLARGLRAALDKMNLKKA
jgi:hypothetical protein